MNTTSKKLTATILALAIMTGANSGTLSNVTNSTLGIQHASALSLDAHWMYYDLYLSHNEAQLAGWVYSFFPGLPMGVKQVVHANGKKIRKRDEGRGVRIRLIKAAPFSTIVFFYDVYPR